MMMLVAENWRRMADRSQHAAMTRTAPWELTKQPNKQAKATKVQRTAADPGRVGNQSSCHQHTKKSTMRMAPAAWRRKRRQVFRRAQKERALADRPATQLAEGQRASPRFPCSPIAEGRVRCDGASISGPSRQRPLPVRHRTFSLVFHAPSDHMTCMQIFHSGRWTCMHALYRAVLLCLGWTCPASATDHWIYPPLTTTSTTCFWSGEKKDPRPSHARARLVGSAQRPQQRTHATFPNPTFPPCLIYG